ncbi:aminoglycoside phosphotransferase [Paenibacillus sp. 598K]|uniref:oxidoreductase family protein n=1 Tax=Paenibacillus sp. 598K TaxID=1117987 RepID=UPI000FFAE615|nr:oxidoreductase family protein [Paenibacillus sp. 598K]GBF75084.1 aminoglycoside phosphotransferase [Paenibacillus sp. 598K]
MAEQIDKRQLTSVTHDLLGTNRGMITEWCCRSIGPSDKNFVTGGVYRIAGRSDIGEEEIRPWSIIIKIVKADALRDDPSHYNYWKREILAYDSGFLHHLPAEITVPRCLAIDNKPDDTVWLWLEDIQTDAQEWQWEDYAYAAEKLGQFQAAYLLGAPLPRFPWVNQQWMRSWINECYRYRDAPDAGTSRQLVSGMKFVDLATRFDRLEGRVEDWLAALERLPRTLAHQDYYESNLLITLNRQQERKLVIIDWQFLSISGIGEDLGRFFGLALSRGNVPLEHYQKVQELFFSSYIKGLRHTGWLGDERLARFGFLASFALRSIWEVPKLQQKLAQDAGAPETLKLAVITEKQMEAAEEAEELRGSV